MLWKRKLRKSIRKQRGPVQEVQNPNNNGSKKRDKGEK